MRSQQPFAIKPAVPLASTAAEDSTGDRATVPTQLDAAALGRLRELDPTGANQLLPRVFKAFDASTRRLLPLLEEARRTGNHAGIRHVAHTMKSSSASIGALRLSQLSAEVEAMARSGEVEGLAARIEQMTAETAAVLQALQQFPGNLP